MTASHPFDRASKRTVFRCVHVCMFVCVCVCGHFLNRMMWCNLFWLKKRIELFALISVLNNSLSLIHSFAHSKPYEAGETNNVWRFVKWRVELIFCLRVFGLDFVSIEIATNVLWYANRVEEKNKVFHQLPRVAPAAKTMPLLNQSHPNKSTEKTSISFLDPFFRIDRYDNDCEKQREREIRKDF